MLATLAGRTRWLIRGKSGAAAVVQTTMMQLLTLAVNLTTGIMTARLLAPAGRGELAAINLIPGLTGYLLTFGIPTALLYRLKQDPENSRQLIGSALIIVSILGTLAVLVGYEIMPYVLRQYPLYVISLAQLFMLTTPLALYNYVCSSSFESAGNFWYSNGARLLSPLLALTSLCICYVAGHLNVLTAAASYALPSLPIGIKLIVDVVRNHHPIVLPIRQRPYQQLFSYGIRVYGIDLLSTIGTQIDQVLVVSFLSPATMGLYAVALAVSRILQVVQSSIVRVLLPRVAARPRDEVVAVVGRAVRISAALTSAACVGVILLAPVLLRLAYGGKFVGASNVLRILAAEALVAGATWVLAQAFLALGKPAVVTGLQACGLLLTIPLMILLIPRLGLVGAGLSLLISTTARFLFIVCSYPLLLHSRPPQLLLQASDIAFVRSRLLDRTNVAPAPITDS